MAAYMISEVEILNEELAGAYRMLAVAAITEYGDRYLARGAEPDAFEGAPTVRRIVSVEFEPFEKARAWYASPAYAEALELRGTALDRRLMLVEGVTGST